MSINHNNEIRQSSGAFFQSNVTPTVFALQNVQVPIVGTVLLGSATSKFSLVGSALKYTGAVKKSFKIDIVGCAKAAADKAAIASIGINGANQSVSEICMSVVNNSGNVFTTTLLIDIDTGDEIIGMFGNATDTVDITVLFYRMTIIEA